MSGPDIIISIGWETGHAEITSYFSIAALKGPDSTPYSRETGEIPLDG